MAVIVRTVDEAVKALTTHWAACQDAYGLVLALEALGLMRVERLSTRDRFIKALRDQGYAEGSTSMAHALQAFDEAAK